MDEIKTAERLAIIEQDMKSIHRRLDDLERLTESVHTIATEVKYMRENINGLNNRLDEIEQRPRRRWDAVLKAAVTAAVTAVVGFLAGRFLK